MSLRSSLLSILLAIFFHKSMPINANVAVAITDLHIYSRKVNADSVLITRESRPILSYASNCCTERFDAMEISQSFISFAFMLLIDEGAIPSLDVPLRYYCPTPNHYNTSLRQILNSSQDTDCALAVSLIKKISGKSFEDYILTKLFLPLSIRNVAWRYTSSDGYPHLLIASEDLAKIGTLIIRKGLWNNKHIISEKSLEQMFIPNICSPFNVFHWHLEFFDLACWWDDDLLRFYAQKGVPCEWIYKLAGLHGRVIHCCGHCYGGYSLEFVQEDLMNIFGSHTNANTFISTIYSLNLPLANCHVGKIKSICAIGTGGQQLLILPQHNIVAVRQRHIPPAASYPCENLEFTHLVNELGVKYNDIETR